MSDSPKNPNDIIRDVLIQIQNAGISREAPRIKNLTINEGEVSFSDEMAFVFSYEDEMLFGTYSSNPNLASSAGYRIILLSIRQ